MNPNYQDYMDLLLNENVASCASILIPEASKLGFIWEPTPEGVVSNLAGYDGKHIHLTLLLSRDPSLIHENNGLPLWNAVICKCEKNVDVLIAFGADLSYSFQWSDEDKKKFNKASEEMRLIEDGILSFVF